MVIQLGDGAPVAQELSSFKELADAGRISSIRLIGDSITAGYLCDGWVDPGQARATKVIYSSDSASCYEPSADIRCGANDFRAWAAGHGISDFTNASIPGATMAMLAAEPQSWIGEGADVIFVMLGTNDQRSYTSEQFRSCAEVALASVRAKCRLMVVVAPPDNRQDGRFSAKECADILKEVCEKNGYCYVSLYGSIHTTSPEMNADGIHPTSEGSERLWINLQHQLGLTD